MKRGLVHKTLAYLFFIAKEGVLRTDAESDMSPGCLGSLCTLFDHTTESFKDILKDFKSLIEKSKTEESKDGV